ncbi:hypothetical protein BDF19DRAFT_414308 [Syncephalis fuscata]|nr:hypothetical protein BDF19DRAFT_414308 [Syncephalis fuscata]
MNQCNNDISAIEDLVLRPCVPMYHPSTLKGLIPGRKYQWCTCGLSKQQPWCDGKSHQKTRFKPLSWTVPEYKGNPSGQRLFSICNCKYTKTPPYCDGIHYDLPLKYLAQIRACQQEHNEITMVLCDHCGWKPPPKEQSVSQSSVIEEEEEEEEEESGEEVIIHDNGDIQILTIKE